MQAEIEKLFEEKPQTYTDADFRLFHDFKAALNAGAIRAAEPDASAPSGWRVNLWVKKGILLGFRMGGVVDMSVSASRMPFYDKATFPVRHVNGSSGVRIVPGGSSIRDGVYLGRGITCMPPMYINTGAWVDDGTMVDSHALVGSCAQIGKNCHISAASQIGGVLEPLQAGPVIVEDDCFIGARSEVVEGVVVETGSVISMGVFIGASTKIVDRNTGEIHIGRVPAYSVVVPGNLPGKPLPDGSPGPSTYCAVILKRVDAGTRAKTSINELLRG